MDKKGGQMGGWTGGQTDGQTNGRTNGRMDKQTDGHPQNDPECPQTLFPLEYSAVSPLFLSRINTHTETNTASANAGCNKILRDLTFIQ